MHELRTLAATALALMIAMSGALVWQGRTSAPRMVAVAAAKSKPHLHYEIVAFAPKPLTMVKALVADPRPAPARPLAIARAVSKAMLPPNTIVAAPLPPQAVTPPDPATTDEEAARVAARVSAKVPAELAPYFDTFIYVSKAERGPWAQHLYLFKKASDGTLALDQDFPVSTGRERSEQYFTATPTGLFELDSHRFIPNARSAKWNDASMPWAMFLNYSYRTQMSGVALHAAVGRHEIADIGHRASGGCVRLPLAKANLFFHRFLADERGQVPVFTFDETRGTTNTAGAVTRDLQGNIVLADGVRVLVIIDNFGGTPAPDSQS